MSKSPLSQKITFLVGKGLTDAEVQQALAIAAGEAARPATTAADGAAAQTVPAQLPSWQQQNQISGGSYAPYSGTAYAPSQGLMRPRTPPRRDWRDYFVSSASLAAAGLPVAASHRPGPGVVC